VNEDDDLDEPLEEVEDPRVCTACGSPDIYRTPRLAMFAIAGMAFVGIGIAVEMTDVAFLGIAALAVFFLITGRWRCSECGENWN
jgi:hypothetical protein